MQILLWQLDKENESRVQKKFSKFERKTETPFLLKIIVPEISAVEKRAETWPVWFRAGGQVMQGKPKRGKGKSGERLDK